MTAEHFDGLLKALQSRKPFQFFAVELRGGERFEVDDPEALVVRDGVAVFLAAGGRPIWFNYENVTQVEG